MKTQTNIVMDENFDMERILGLHVTELPADLDFDSGYPVVDRDGIVTGIVDGKNPETLADGNWTTGAWIDGRVVTGEHYADLAITIG